MNTLGTPLKHPWDTLEKLLRHPWQHVCLQMLWKKLTTDRHTNTLLELLIAAKNVGSKSQDKKYWPRNFCPNSKDFGLRKFLVQNVLKTFLNFLQTTLNTYWETPLRYLEAPCCPSALQTSKTLNKTSCGWAVPSWDQLTLAISCTNCLLYSTVLI